MPKLKENQVPSHRLRKQSGQSIVTGEHGSAASRAEYWRLTGEWRAANGTMSIAVGSDLASGTRQQSRKPDAASQAVVDACRLCPSQLRAAALQLAQRCGRASGDLLCGGFAFASP